MGSEASSATNSLGFDVEALRARYRAERDKRQRADGNEQYVETKGDFSRYVDDPYVKPGFTREPLTDEVEVAHHRRWLRRPDGGGAAARGGRAKRSASSTKAATSAAPGTGTAIRARNATSSHTSTCRCSRRPATSRRSAIPSRRKSSSTPSASRRNTTSTATPASRPKSRTSPGTKKSIAGSSPPIAMTACGRATW